MKEEREEKIYKSLMLVVITVIITFLITSVTVYKAIAKNGIKYVKITDGEVTGLDETLASFRKVLEKEYLGEIDDETLVEGALKGYVEALGDPYTEYYTKEEMEKLMDTTNGNYVGIGIYMLVDKEKQTIVVLKPMENSPAEQAGILAGDIITKVDGEGYTLDTITEVSNKIKGKAGTKVKLEIKRGEKETFEIEVERKKILISHINTKVLKDNIGYIYISDFDGGCADEFTQKYKELKKQGIEKLIIDIRNNGGGIVDEAINILKLITDKGDTLLITKDKNENEKITKNDKDPIINMPIVVLTNEYSASASEIMTGALKDNEKATIIGTITYGKGVIQTIHTLADGSGLKITTNEYYTPKYYKINKVGIEPNIKVDVPEEYKNKTTIPEEKEYTITESNRNIKIKNTIKNIKNDFEVN